MREVITLQRLQELPGSVPQVDCQDRRLYSVWMHRLQGSYCSVWRTLEFGWFANIIHKRKKFIDVARFRIVVKCAELHFTVAENPTKQLLLLLLRSPAQTGNFFCQGAHYCELLVFFSRQWGPSRSCSRSPEAKNVVLNSCVRQPVSMFRQSTMPYNIVRNVANSSICDGNKIIFDGDPVFIYIPARLP